MPLCQSQLSAIHMWVCLTFAPCLQAFLFASIRIVGLFLRETWHCLCMGVCLFYAAGTCRAAAVNHWDNFVAAQRSGYLHLSPVFFLCSFVSVCLCNVATSTRLSYIFLSKGKITDLVVTVGFYTWSIDQLQHSGNLNTYKNKWHVYLHSLFQHAQELYTMNLASPLLPAGLLYALYAVVQFNMQFISSNIYCW